MPRATPARPGSNPHYHGRDSMAPPAPTYVGGKVGASGMIGGTRGYCDQCGAAGDWDTDGMGRVFLYQWITGRRTRHQCTTEETMPENGRKLSHEERDEIAGYVVGLLRQGYSWGDVGRRITGNKGFGRKAAEARFVHCTPEILNTFRQYVRKHHPEVDFTLSEEDRMTVLRGRWAALTQEEQEDVEEVVKDFRERQEKEETFPLVHEALPGHQARWAPMDSDDDAAAATALIDYLTGTLGLPLIELHEPSGYGAMTEGAFRQAYKAKRYREGTLANLRYYAASLNVDMQQVYAAREEPKAAKPDQPDQPDQPEVSAENFRDGVRHRLLPPSEEPRREVVVHKLPEEPVKLPWWQAVEQYRTALEEASLSIAGLLRPASKALQAARENAPPFVSSGLSPHVDGLEKLRERIQDEILELLTTLEK